MTLTYELDLDMVKISNHAKVSTTSHFDQKLPSEHGDTHTHTSERQHNTAAEAVENIAVHERELRYILTSVVIANRRRCC